MPLLPMQIQVRALGRTGVLLVAEPRVPGGHCEGRRGK